MPNETPPAPTFWRMPDVCRFLTIGKSTLYELVARDPSFPRRVRIGQRAVVWRRDEIEAWANARPRVETGASTPNQTVA